MRASASSCSFSTWASVTRSPCSRRTRPHCSIPKTAASGADPRRRLAHMHICVCVKRVPLTGGKMTLTEDQRGISTKHLCFTVSPHDECGVEEAVQIVERECGSVTVLTLGPAEAEEQLRDMMAIGADRATHPV